MTPEQLKTLMRELNDSRYTAILYEGKDINRALAGMLNAPTEVANPVRQPPKVAGKLRLVDVFAAIKKVAPSDLIEWEHIPSWMVQLVINALTDDDREALGNQIELLGMWGYLSSRSIEAIQGLMAQTVDDPAWSSTKQGPSRAETLGLPVVTVQDVINALRMWSGR